MIQKPKFQRNQTQTFVSVILQKFKYKVTYGARLNTAFPNAPEQFQEKIRETRPHFTRLSSRNLLNLIRLTCSRGVPLRYATCSNIQASSGFQNLSMSCLLPLSKVQARSLRTRNKMCSCSRCVVHGLPRLPLAAGSVASWAASLAFGDWLGCLLHAVSTLLKLLRFIHSFILSNLRVRRSICSASGGIHRKHKPPAT